MQQIQQQKLLTPANPMGLLYFGSCCIGFEARFSAWVAMCWQWRRFVCRIFGNSRSALPVVAPKVSFCGQPVANDDMCSLTIVSEPPESAKVTCI